VLRPKTQQTRSATNLGWFRSVCIDSLLNRLIWKILQSAHWIATSHIDSNPRNKSLQGRFGCCGLLGSSTESKLPWQQPKGPFLLLIIWRSRCRFQQLWEGLRSHLISPLEVIFLVFRTYHSVWQWDGLFQCLLILLKLAKARIWLQLETSCWDTKPDQMTWLKIFDPYFGYVFAVLTHVQISTITSSSMQFMEVRWKLFIFCSHLELMPQFYPGLEIRKTQHSLEKATMLIYVVVYFISHSIVVDQRSLVYSFPKERTQRTLMSMVQHLFSSSFSPIENQLWLPLPSSLKCWPLIYSLGSTPNPAKAGLRYIALQPTEPVKI